MAGKATSKLSGVLSSIERKFGEAQARRLQRAVDEGMDPELWKPKDLEDQFGYRKNPITGTKFQNSGLITTMGPGEFETLARPIMNPNAVPYNRWDDPAIRNKPPMDERTLQAYLEGLRRRAETGGLTEPGQLWIDRNPHDRQSFVEGHEGRHRMRMLGEMNERGLVNVRPAQEGELRGEADEVIERLNRIYWPQGEGTKFKPEDTRTGFDRGALSFPGPLWAHGGAVPGYKVRGRVQAVEGLAKKLGEAVEEAERKVRAHTQATGNEGMMFGLMGAPAETTSELIKGDRTSVKLPPWADRFVSNNTESPWFSLHSHPNDSISPSLNDYKVWSKSFGNPLALVDDDYGLPYGNMLIAKEPKGGLLRIGSIDSGGDMPPTLQSAVFQAKRTMDNRLDFRDPLDPVRSSHLDYLKSNRLFDPDILNDPRRSSVVNSTLREMSAGNLLNNIAARDVPVQLDASTLLTGTNAPLADVWSELAKMAAKKGELAEGGRIDDDDKDRYSLAPPRGRAPSFEFPLGKGTGIAGFNYDPSGRVIDAELGYEHPLGTRGAKLGVRGNFNKYVGPGGNEAKPELGGALRLTLPFAEGGRTTGTPTPHIRGNLPTPREMPFGEDEGREIEPELYLTQPWGPYRRSLPGARDPDDGALRSAGKAEGGTVGYKSKGRVETALQGALSKLAEAMLGPMSKSGYADTFRGADARLSGPAGEAVTNFVGHPHNAMELIDYNNPYRGMGIMSPYAFEGIDRIESFNPLRDLLREQHGDKIPLMRVEKPVKNPDPRRDVFSWTSDPQFAAEYAGIRPVKPLMDERFIKAMEEEYARTGVAPIDKRFQIRREPVFEGGPSYPQIYEGEEHLTDTDSVRAFIEGENEERIRRALENEKRQERIKAAPIDLNDVLWATDRAGQSEFITRYPYGKYANGGAVMAEGGALSNIPGYKVKGRVVGALEKGAEEIEKKTQRGALRGEARTREAERLLEEEKRANLGRGEDDPPVTLPPAPRLQTVSDPVRLSYPGIYKDPRDIIKDARERMLPESESMMRLFGVNRGDLDAISQGRDWSHLLLQPHAFYPPPGATGSEISEKILTPRNLNRLVDIGGEALGDADLKKTRSWYEMLPLWQRMTELGTDPAYQRLFNARIGLHSAGASPVSEINRGTLANKLIQEGRLDDYLLFGGIGQKGTTLKTGEYRPSRFEMPNFPPDMLDAPSHAYHGTAHSPGLIDLETTGQLWSPKHKVPTYVQATDPQLADPRRPIADSHLARGVGYPDVRTAKSEGALFKELTNPEYSDFVPWWERASGTVGEQPRDFQALMWNVLGPQTGVRYIGPPKLEMLSDQIMKGATRLGIDPELMRDRVLTGHGAAYAKGGDVKNDTDPHTGQKTSDQPELNLDESFGRTKYLARLAAKAIGDKVSGLDEEYEQWKRRQFWDNQGKSTGEVIGENLGALGRTIANNLAPGNWADKVVAAGRSLSGEDYTRAVHDEKGQTTQAPDKLNPYVRLIAGGMGFGAPFAAGKQVAGLYNLTDLSQRMMEPQNSAMAKVNSVMPAEDWQGIMKLGAKFLPYLGADIKKFGSDTMGALGFAEGGRGKRKDSGWYEDMPYHPKEDVGPMQNLPYRYNEDVGPMRNLPYYGEMEGMPDAMRTAPGIDPDTLRGIRDLLIQSGQPRRFADGGLNLPGSNVLGAGDDVAQSFAKSIIPGATDEFGNLPDIARRTPEPLKFAAPQAQQQSSSGSKGSGIGSLLGPIGAIAGSFIPGVGTALGGAIGGLAGQAIGQRGGQVSRMPGFEEGGLFDSDSTGGGPLFNVGDQIMTVGDIIKGSSPALDRRIVRNDLQPETGGANTVNYGTTAAGPSARFYGYHPEASDPAMQSRDKADIRRLLSGSMAEKFGVPRESFRRGGSVDDDMLAYHVMNYADGGDVVMPGGAGGARSDREMWPNADIWKALDPSKEREGGDLRQEGNTDFLGGLLKGEIGGMPIGGLLPLLLGGLTGGSKGGGGLGNIVSMLSPAAAVGSAVSGSGSLFADGGPVNGGGALRYCGGGRY